MLDDGDIQLWDESAEAWIRHLDKHGDQSRRFLDPRLFAAMGNLQSQKVLDIGCGEGRFARMLAERGADVTGVEPADRLLRRANEVAGGPNYVQTRAETLPFEDHTFDVAIYYLVLIDIEPFEPALTEAYRILKPGGKCVIANSTGMNTATNRLWERNSQGERTAWLVEHYGTRQRIPAEWNGIRVHNYHRPLSTYFAHCLATGFRLTHFDEPMPTDAEVAAEPNLQFHRICPFFNIQIWDKEL